MRDTDLRPPDPAAVLADWIRLEQTPGVGGTTVRKLLAQFGSPQHIFEAGYRALCDYVPAPVARALSEPAAPAILRQVDLTMNWLAHAGNHLMTLHDAAYPPALANIPDPPPLLYLKGWPELLAAPMLAIVGSRNATLQGRTNAEVFAQALSCSGLTIVSGLALGIDASAHQGALGGAGSTVAVIGTGAETVTPRAITRWRTASRLKAASSANTRSARRRCRPTSRAATASSAGWRPACWWSRLPQSRVR